VEWISAAEGEKYARVITEMDDKLATLDKETLREETAKARPEIARRLKRWATVPGMAEMLEEEEVLA